MQLEAAHAVEIPKLVEYVDRKEDPLIHLWLFDGNMFQTSKQRQNVTVPTPLTNMGNVLNPGHWQNGKRTSPFKA